MHRTPALESNEGSLALHRGRSTVSAGAFARVALTGAVAAALERDAVTAAVLNEFGLPQSKSAPVGEPPISIWRYPDYTVYFESETVIHSVLTHTPKVELTTDSGE